MTAGWLREEQPEVAVDKILDAAEKAFIELGVSGAGMARIAEYAGCSRGTLYRYFKDRHELHLAYVNRAARRLVDGMAGGLSGIRDPRERLVEAIVRSVRMARENPGTAAWFTPAESGAGARMSRGSEVIDALAGAFVATLFGGRPDDPESILSGRWLVRVIVSLLTTPGEDEQEERALIERFVVPSLLQGRGRS